MKIEGKVVYMNMEGGFYGIIDQTGRKFFPLNMPNQLKKEGADVKCTIRIAEVETTFMWGEPVYIESFETIS